MPSYPDLPALRRQMRERRRGLGPVAQRVAARRLCRRVSASEAFRRARRIAVYMAADGEIDPAPLARLARQLGKQTCLPVLHPLRSDSMIFVVYSDSDRLHRNRFGIPEPRLAGRSLRPWQLDLVLMPLVAFDPAGNRLGMGGGFYDRTFALARQRRWPRRPRLCGLAHQFQHVPALPARDWDVPLARVFTDRGPY